MTDWLDADADWLNVEPPPERPTLREGDPADDGMPGISEQALVAAGTAVERKAQFIAAWTTLTPEQRVYLNTWRESRFNGSRALRILATSKGYSKTNVLRWNSEPAYEYARTMLREASVEEILSKSYLVTRQEDIVETALTPQAILHQGFATGHFEVNVGAATKANETLLKIGGHLKEEKQELNIGIVGPSFAIQVVQPNGEVKDITHRGVTIELPAPAEDGDWLDAP